MVQRPHRSRQLSRQQLLRHFGDHDNIVTIVDLLPPTDPEFRDIYIVPWGSAPAGPAGDEVLDLLATDLHRVIRSGKLLSLSPVAHPQTMSTVTRFLWFLRVMDCHA